MTCCTIDITPFFNSLIDTVSYTGPKPTVNVVYRQPDNTYLEMGVLTNIEITPTEVIVTHGGLSTGFIKLITNPTGGPAI